MEHDIDEYDMQDWAVTANAFNHQKYMKYLLSKCFETGDEIMTMGMRKDFIGEQLRYMKDLMKTFQEHPYPAIVSHLRKQT